MGWRSDYPVSREFALEEIIATVLRMSDDQLSDLLDQLNPGRTVNYRVESKRGE